MDRRTFLQTSIAAATVAASNPVWAAETHRIERVGLQLYTVRDLMKKDFEGTMIFVSHDRMFLRGLGSRVLELGGESGKDRNPRVYPGSYLEYVRELGHEAPGIYS